MSALFALSYPAASSTLTYNFSFTGSGLTSNGSLTVSHTGSTYLVTNIIGLYNSSTITSLIAAGGYDANDNLVFPTGPFLDFSGVSFAVGGKDYNVFYDNGTHGCESAGYYVDVIGTVLCGSTYDKAVRFSMTAATTPEPSGKFSLILAALSIGLIVVIRRRVKERLAAPAGLSSVSLSDAIREKSAGSQRDLTS